MDRTSFSFTIVYEDGILEVIEIDANEITTGLTESEILQLKMSEHLEGIAHNGNSRPTD